MGPEFLRRRVATPLIGACRLEMRGVGQSIFLSVTVTVTVLRCSALETSCGEDGSGCGAVESVFDAEERMKVTAASTEALATTAQELWAAAWPEDGSRLFQSAVIDGKKLFVVDDGLDRKALDIMYRSLMSQSTPLVMQSAGHPQSGKRHVVAQHPVDKLESRVDKQVLGVILSPEGAFRELRDLRVSVVNSELPLISWDERSSLVEFSKSGSFL